MVEGQEPSIGGLEEWGTCQKGQGLLERGAYLRSFIGVRGLKIEEVIKVAGGT